MSTAAKKDKKTDKERKQSLYPKSDADSIGRKSSLEPPTGLEQRRPSMDFSHRRPSIDNRKLSIVESIPGRSTLIMTSAQTQRQNVKYENTYKLTPDSKVRNDALKDCIQHVFESKLQDVQYDAGECGKLSASLSDSLKQRAKMLGLDRYKFVTAVFIIQREKYNPSIAVASRCVWNEKFDTFSQYTYKNKSLCALGLIYAMYAE